MMTVAVPSGFTLTWPDPLNEAGNPYDDQENPISASTAGPNPHTST
jgi:hypothetical protein